MKFHGPIAFNRRSNLKKHYLAAMANSTLFGMLAKSGRSLTVSESDPRVQEMQGWLSDARTAAVALALGIEARHELVVAHLRAYATEQDKDWVGAHSVVSPTRASALPWMQHVAR